MRATASAERVSHPSVQGYIGRVATIPEGWPSGLRRTLGKRVYGKPYRGFESHSLRQYVVRHCSPPFTKSRFLQYFSAIGVCTYPSAFALIPQKIAGDFVGLGGGFNRAEVSRNPSAQPTNGRTDSCRTSSID